MDAMQKMLVSMLEKLIPPEVIKMLSEENIKNAVLLVNAKLETYETLLRSVQHAQEMHEASLKRIEDILNHDYGNDRDAA